MSRWTPHVTVASVVERAGRYLLVEEDKGGPFSLFNQPAGHLEPGERLTQAAERETREEAAWHITLTGYLGLYVYTAPDELTFHSHAFVGMPLAHLGNELDSSIIDAHWLTLDEIEALEHAHRLRSPLVLKRIRDAIAGRQFSLDVIHER